MYKKILNLNLNENQNLNPNLNEKENYNDVIKSTILISIVTGKLKSDQLLEVTEISETCKIRQYKIKYDDIK